MNLVGALIRTMNLVVGVVGLFARQTDLYSGQVVRIVRSVVVGVECQIMILVVDSVLQISFILVEVVAVDLRKVKLYFEPELQKFLAELEVVRISLLGLVEL